MHRSSLCSYCFGWKEQRTARGRGHDANAGHGPCFFALPFAVCSLANYSAYIYLLKVCTATGELAPATVRTAAQTEERKPSCGWRLRWEKEWCNATKGSETTRPAQLVREEAAGAAESFWSHLRGYAPLTCGASASAKFNSSRRDVDRMDPFRLRDEMLKKSLFTINTCFIWQEEISTSSLTTGDSSLWCASTRNVKAKLSLITDSRASPRNLRSHQSPFAVTHFQLRNWSRTHHARVKKKCSHRLRQNTLTCLVRNSLCQAPFLPIAVGRWTECDKQSSSKKFIWTSDGSRLPIFILSDTVVSVFYLLL